MKARKLMLVAVLVAGAVSGLWADTPVRMAIVKRGEGVYKVIYSGDASESTITIKNRFGEVVFSERINSAKGFILPLNFSRLQPGVYTVEVVSGRERFTDEIFHGEETKSPEAPFIAHITRLSANRYLCSVKATAHLPLKLTVLSESGEAFAVHPVTEAETAFVISLQNFTGRPVFVLENSYGQSVTIRK
ncbi:MAG: hypothetical protein NZM13_09710 [Cyclobacteriaceae bacterium]|nr:hypothetical protein [Cyclobacteriaceae bacterium]MDW8331710.1 hypothetical protein [Cyclobacteriaceae bacterium]